MALVRDYNVKRMNWYRNLFRIFLDFTFTGILRKHSFFAEEIDSHSLDCTNVDECVFRLGIFQIIRRHPSRVNLVIVWQVFFSQELGVDLVNLVEFQSGLWLKSGEGSNCLSGQRPSINEEENSSC